MTNYNTALDQIAACFTEAEEREAIQFESVMTEFNEYVEAEVHYESDAEYITRFMNTARYAD